MLTGSLVLQPHCGSSSVVLLRFPSRPPLSSTFHRPFLRAPPPEKARVAYRRSRKGSPKSYHRATAPTYSPSHSSATAPKLTGAAEKRWRRPRHDAGPRRQQGRGNNNRRHHHAQEWLELQAPARGGFQSSSASGGGGSGGAHRHEGRQETSYGGRRGRRRWQRQQARRYADLREPALQQEPVIRLQGSDAAPVLQAPRGAGNGGERERREGDVAGSKSDRPTHLSSLQVFDSSLASSYLSKFDRGR